MEIKKIWKKVWYFIWEDDSFWSWIVNILLAFILVKFIIYPGLGLLLGTSFPVVAVVSCSMEHNADFGSCSFDHANFGEWYDIQSEHHKSFGINKEEFLNYKFMNGFNKGDLMVLTGYGEVERGDVIVFRGEAMKPIIHRVVRTSKNANEETVFQTKGDNNGGSRADELDVGKDRYLGKALFRIPYLGWFKLVFTEIFKA